MKAVGIQGDRIEVEMPGSVVVLGREGLNEAISIESVDGQTSIVGDAVATSADGVLILDLHPGIVMVELANPHDAGVARESIRVVGGWARVYPTGI